LSLNIAQISATITNTFTYITLVAIYILYYVNIPGNVAIITKKLIRSGLTQKNYL